MLDAGETMKQLEAAVQEARAFFGIDPLWKTPVRPEGAGQSAARVDASGGYLFAPIAVDLDYYMRQPEKVREDMAHEVAHLVTNEMWQLWKNMPDISEDETVTGRMMRSAVESATVRLERLFMRERPVAGSGVIRTVPDTHDFSNLMGENSL